MAIMILHHNDADGICAAAIALKHAKDGNFKYYTKELRYNEDIGPIPEDVDTVYILDLSFDIPTMNNLSEKYYLIWIDHHMTAISKLDRFSYLSGIREDGIATCILSWNYFFSKYDIPKIVEYIGDRDVWAFKFGDTTRHVHAIITLLNPKANSLIWEEWFVCFPEFYLDFGKLVYENKTQQIKEYVDAHAMPIVLVLSNAQGEETLTKGLVCNISDKTWVSEAGDYMYSKADFAWIYHIGLLNGETVKFNQLRSENFNVGKFALLQGGGGHFQSAGFVEPILSDLLTP